METATTVHRFLTTLRGFFWHSIIIAQNTVFSRTVVFGSSRVVAYQCCWCSGYRRCATRPWGRTRAAGCRRSAQLERRPFSSRTQDPPSCTRLVVDTHAEHKKLTTTGPRKRQNNSSNRKSTFVLTAWFAYSLYKSYAEHMQNEIKKSSYRK